MQTIKAEGTLILIKEYPLYNPYYPVGAKFKFTGTFVACGYRTLIRVLDEESNIVYIPISYFDKGE